MAARSLSYLIDLRRETMVATLRADYKDPALPGLRHKYRNVTQLIKKEQRRYHSDTIE